MTFSNRVRAALLLMAACLSGEEAFAQFGGPPIGTGPLELPLGRDPIGGKEGIIPIEPKPGWVTPDPTIDVPRHAPQWPPKGASGWSGHCGPTARCVRIPSTGGGPAATPGATYSIASSGGGVDPSDRLFVFVNKCWSSVTLAVRYRDRVGNWRNEGWYTLGPSEEITLANTSGLLVTRSSVFYFYAQGAPSGLPRWKGPHEKQFNAVVLPMIEVYSDHGDFVKSLTCD